MTTLEAEEISVRQAGWKALESACDEHRASYLEFFGEKITEEQNPRMPQKVSPVVRSEYGFDVVDEAATQRKLDQAQIESRTEAQARAHRWVAKQRSVEIAEQAFQTNRAKLRKTLQRHEFFPSAVFRVGHWNEIVAKADLYQLLVTKDGKTCSPLPRADAQAAMHGRNSWRSSGIDKLFPEHVSAAQFSKPLFGKGKWILPSKGTVLSVRMNAPSSEVLERTHALAAIDATDANWEMRMVCASDGFSVALEDTPSPVPSNSPPFLQMRCGNAVALLGTHDHDPIHMHHVERALDTCDTRSLG